MMPAALNILLLVAMIALQAAWLVGIYWSRATDRMEKVIRCAVLDASAGLIILLITWLFPETWVRLDIVWAGMAARRPAGMLILFTLAAAAAVAYAQRQRVWTFDEEGNQYAARHIAKSGLKQALTQYDELPWLGMQHPPLIPWLGGLLLRLFGDRLIVLRLLSVLFFIGTLAVTYQIGAGLYGALIGSLAVLLSLAFPLNWRLGSAAMLDIPAAFWFGLSLLASLNSSGKTGEPLWMAAVAGAAIGLGMLTRYTIVLIYPVELALLYLGYLSWPAFMLILLVSSSILSIWLYYSFRLGILQKQTNMLLIYFGKKPGDPSARPQSKGMLGKLGITRGWRMRLRLESLVTRLPSSLGAYCLPVILLGAIQMWQQPRAGDGVLAAWIGIPFILLMILLPDHRYYLPIFPALALVMARGLVGSEASVSPGLLLALIFCLVNLYLFVDWKRQTYLFSRDGI